MTDSATVQALAQHPPAVKVGGRRLSINTRHKSSTNPIASPTAETTASSQVPEPTTSDDYPRPSAHEHADTEEQGNAVDPPKIHQQHHEKEKEKDKDKHHKDAANLENKLKRRAEENTRPTRDAANIGGKGGFGAAGRIAQPGGKLAI